MSRPQLAIFDGPDDLAAAAAQLVSRLAASAIDQSGQFTMALAGGSTPQRTYARLARGQADERLDWTKTWLFFGDERWVDPRDDRSNYKMVRQSLLLPAAVPKDRVFPVPTSLATVQACAQAYANTLSHFFGTASDRMPVLDFVLLGLGDDGHTASLFPGAAALNVTDTSATSSPPGTLPPSVDRVTLTFAAINAARDVVFLVSGANKATAFADVWLERATRGQRPAIGVRPAQGNVTWLVDRAAAGDIGAQL